MGEKVAVMTQQGQGNVARAFKALRDDVEQFDGNSAGEGGLFSEKVPPPMRSYLVNWLRRFMAEHGDTVEALLSSSRGEQGWRTIDSAPKDGTFIDIWAVNPVGRRYTSVRWHDPEVEIGAVSGPAWRDWQQVPVIDHADAVPTHWMPLPSAPGSVPTSQMRPHGGIAACYDCNRPYGDEFGFPDLVLPNDVWSAISPTKNEGGLLCPSCICKRLHSAGIETHGVFRSGPLSETSLAGHKILEGLRDAVAGDLPRVTIEGVTYVRQDAGSPEALLAASRQTIIDLQTELDVLKAAFTGGADHG